MGGYSGGGSGTSPFRVLGIALVVEEPGRGARLVFRYPASLPPPPSLPAALHPPHHAMPVSVQAAAPAIAGGVSETSATAADSSTATSAPPSIPVSAASPTSHRHPPSCELFFTLSARSMAKLFRPKPPLCGQPMTLSIGGTVFCCHAILLPGGGMGGNGGGGNGDGGGGGGGGGGQDNANVGGGENEEAIPSAAQQPKGLVLFSVIVALAPLHDFSKTFRFDGGGDRLDGGLGAHLTGRKHPTGPASPRVQQYASAISRSSIAVGGGDRNGEGQLSSSLLAVRAVHLSLRRLCRVLQREERRCRYVTQQASLMVQIKSEAAPSVGVGSGGGSGGQAGGGDGKAQIPKSRHKRVSSAVSSATSTPHPSDRSNSGDGRSVVDPECGGRAGTTSVEDVKSERKRREQEDRQVAVDLMLSADISENDGGDQRIRGNLARELAQAFHALSRSSVGGGDSASFDPTPLALLSCADGTVYVNGHVAVPIEPATGSLHPPHFRMNDVVGGRGDLGTWPALERLRSYHTLLFPHASPADLLRTSATPGGSMSGCTSEQRHGERLRRLLLMTSPGKSLSDAAVDAALPLPLAMQLAAHLIDAGTCVPSHVIGRHTHFALNHDGASRMRELALPFAQRFLGPAVPLVLAVAALTAPSALEEGGGSATKTVALGEAMRAAAVRGESGDSAGGVLGERIAAALSSGPVPTMGATADGRGLLRPRNRPRGGSIGEDGRSGPSASPRSSEMLTSSGRGGVTSVAAASAAVPEQAIEDVVYEMALWMRSHAVTVELRDFLVSVNPMGSAGGANRDVGDSLTFVSNRDEPTSLVEGISASATDQPALSSTWSNNHDMGERPTHASREEAIYQELLEAGVLLGNISTAALCWKFELDHWRIQRLREWGIKERKLKTITRIPMPGDDWE